MTACKEDYPELFFKTREDWRQWLTKNHTSSNGIWMLYFKKNSGKRSVSYNEAVEEALCFGWIDSKVNRIDEKRYRQVFTPRKAKSVWSKLNRSRVEKMMKQGKMTSAGMKLVEEAINSGWWDKAYSSNETASEASEDFIKALQDYPEALIFLIA